MISKKYPDMNNNIQTQNNLCQKRKRKISGYQNDLLI